MMTEEFPVERDKISRAPVHPGVFFERNILPEFLRQRRTIGEIARLLNVSRQALYRVTNGQSAVTPDMAARLGKLCGNGADLWLNLGAARGVERIDGGGDRHALHEVWSGKSRRPQVLQRMRVAIWRERFA